LRFVGEVWVRGGGLGGARLIAELVVDRRHLGIPERRYPQVRSESLSPASPVPSSMILYRSLYSST
jgi:hypothetical protein